MTKKENAGTLPLSEPAQCENRELMIDRVADIVNVAAALVVLTFLHLGII